MKRSEAFRRLVLDKDGGLVLECVFDVRRKGMVVGEKTLGDAIEEADFDAPGRLR